MGDGPLDIFHVQGVFDRAGGFEQSQNQTLGHECQRGTDPAIDRCCRLVLYMILGQPLLEPTTKKQMPFLSPTHRLYIYVHSAAKTGV